MKKAFKIIMDLLLVVVVVLVGLIFAPKIFKITPLAVLSGSMEPTYHVGSLVYVDETSPEDIQVGDTITFHISEATLVTHRVVAKDETAKAFTTKGDANDVEDGGKVTYANVVGKVVFSIPFLGYLANFMSTTSGIIITVAVILIILLLSFVPDLIGGDDKEKKKEN